MAAANFGWASIVRLGLVQAALGSIVVLATSTLNRVMVVEIALPALVPGLLVAWHYVMQLARPRMGHGSDVGGRRTPWIVGGMAVLAGGGVVAAVGTAEMAVDRPLGIALAAVGFTMIGLGVSASGTSLLVLLAKRVDDARRAAATTIVWGMMIAGFAITAGVVGHLIDPYTPQRLVAVAAGVGAVALLLTIAAIRGVESGTDRGSAVARAHEGGAAPADEAGREPSFRDAIAQVWHDEEARAFTVFVFVSMLAYSAQDLILEPFAGAVFGFTPGESTRLSGVQHGGVLAGMVLAAFAGSRVAGRPLGSLRAWTVGGCIASALALAGLVAAGFVGDAWPFRATVFVLGASNGAFSIAAISSMMRLASRGAPGQEGVRMGLWGASQAIAFGFGGLAGALASDLARWLIGSQAAAYAAVFACEALLFVWSAAMATRFGAGAPAGGTPAPRADAWLHGRGTGLRGVETELTP